jgi:soluble lytic murein transglycosylase-like protein
LALVLCVVGLPAAAQAQIYSWKDANGVLVLSNRPRESGTATAQTGSAQRTVGVWTPQAVTAEVGVPQQISGESTYDGLIRQYANLRGIRAELVRAVIQVESAFNPRAVSPKGAMGLMQLMPATAARFGVIDPFNPVENIRAGVQYLRILLDRYNDNEQLALAAYNAGPRAVEKYGTKVPPYRETQNYVRKISSIKGNVRSAPAANVYRVTEIVDGQPTIRYTNVKPADGNYEVLPNRR